MKKIIFLALFLACLFPFQVSAQGKKPTEERFEARVIQVVENSMIIEDNGNSHPFQKLRLLATTGKSKGKQVTVENGKYDQTGLSVYREGDLLVLTDSKGPDGISNLTITDYVRRTPIFILFLIFVVLAIIVGTKRGLSSLFGMGITFAILFYYVLPQISKGTDPLLVSSLTAFAVIPLTFFLSHGINKKTFSAIAGTFLTLLIVGVMAYISVEQAHLTGFASEEASYLSVMKNGHINIKGLLFAGIVIGLLGVLQDITVSQAAIVYQLKKASKNMPTSELFARAMDVGRDHIASMTNTLILVYAGASLPLLLLFINNPLPFSQLINSEQIAQEIIVALISSIGLILAVPITTLITTLITSLETQKGK